MSDIPFLELRGLEANLPMKALKAQTSGFQNVSKWCECFPKQKINKNNQNLGFKIFKTPKYLRLKSCRVDCFSLKILTRILA